MITTFCIICGETNNLENHHVRPRSEGGTDEFTNMITLCSFHHGEIHGFQTERKNIGILIKNALATAKARGIKMGSPQNLTPEARAKGRKAGNLACMAKADLFALEVQEIVKHYQSQGLSLTRIAEKMNKENILTPRGCNKAGDRLLWKAQTVKNIILRVVSYTKTRSGDLSIPINKELPQTTGSSLFNM